MTEMEKCLAGQNYDCHAQVFLDLKGRTRKLLKEYHALGYEQKEEKTAGSEGDVWKYRYECICRAALYL